MEKELKWIDGILFELTIENGRVVGVELTPEGRCDIIFEENRKRVDKL